ncbi:MAG: phage tail tape measure protein [Peptococcaceae bacterium]|nr:phage tail tape measure protein [Peptococcaceae bacterium]
MANTSLKVALVLTAVSNIAPVLQQAQRNMASFNQSIKQQQNDFEQYNKKVKQAEEQIKSFQKIQAVGAGHAQGGLMMLAPVEEAARQAAKFEGAMKKVEVANFDAAVPLEEQQRMMEELRAQATKLGAETVFSNLEAAQAQNMLLRNGMEYIDVMNGGAQASLYLAQTAEIAPSMAANAISQITNMYQLQGDQLMFVADQMNRAANASSAGVQNIMQDLQAAGMSAHTLGLKVKDTAMMLGVLHNMGLGDASGTYLNDMLINLDKGTQKAQKALQNMGWLEGATIKYTSSGTAKIIGGENALFNEKGEIKSAEELVKRLRSVLFENSDLKPEDLRDASGQILPEERINELMQAKNKLEAIQNLKDVFGIQGMRAAIALATPGKGSYEDMVAKAERAKSIQDQVLEWQGTLIGKVESLKGSWETLMSESGSPLVKEIKNNVQWLIDMTNKVTAFANTHPLVTKWVLKVLGCFAVGRIAIGGFMWMFGGLGSFIVKSAGYIGSFTRYARGFFDAFKYFRQGAGIFRSLWSAVSFGYPTLMRVGAIFGRMGQFGLKAFQLLEKVGYATFGRLSLVIQGIVTRIGPFLAKMGLSALGVFQKLGGLFLQGIKIAGQFGGSLLKLATQALLAAARIGASWLIALGPIGWIILGVSAIITAAIVAWKTNFLGFRDWLTGAWETVKEKAGAAWEWIKTTAIQCWDDVVGKVQGAIEWFKEAWNWIKGVFHLSSKKPGEDIEAGDVPAYARGGFIRYPHLGLVGEAGPEAIIPLGSYYRAHAMRLYRQVGTMLGVRPYAAGGIVLSSGYEPPVARMLTVYQDNRKYNIYISNPNPAAAAREVAKVTGGMDKYTRSRDPRLQGNDLDLTIA